MSLLNCLISAAHETRSSSAILKDLRSCFILDDERAAYDFVVSHIRNHGVIPSPDTFQHAGFTWEEHQEPPSYYTDRIRKRYIFNVISGLHPTLANSMRDRDMEGAIAALRQMLAEVGAAGSSEAYTTLAAEAMNVIDEYESRRLQGGLAGITTGWDALDNMTGGMMGGDVIVLAGRPSMGKSWCLNEVGYKAWQAGHSVGAVSMEMGKKQFVRRWMGRHLGINPNFIRAGQLSPWTESALRSYPSDALSLPGVFVVSGDMEKHVEGLDSFMAEVMPDILMVDAAYLLTSEGKKRGGVAKWEMIGEVIGQLKKIAIRYDRPVFITVQFNRNVKANDNKREMQLSDIGGSDVIPQDASIVLGARHGHPPYEKVRREICVLKNREGMLGDFEIKFTHTPPSMEQSVRTSEPDAVLSSWMV